MNDMSIKKEPMNKICCELAYTGTLFWLPLLACPKDRKAKYCANQGLWILILSVLSCWLIQILGTVKEMLGGGLLGILTGGIYSLFFMLFLFWMIYLLMNCVKSAVAIHKDERPESILFFQERAIIK